MKPKIVYMLTIGAIFIGLCSVALNGDNRQKTHETEMLTIKTLSLSEMASLVGGQCNCSSSSASCPSKCVSEVIWTPGSQSQENCECWSYSIYESNGCTP